MPHAVSIFLTLLVFLVGGNFVVASNQESSAFLGDLCAFAVQPSSSALGRRTTATVTNKLGSILSSEGYSYDIRSQLTGCTASC